MQNILFFLLLCATWGLAAADHCVSNYTKGVDYFDTKLSVDHALHYTVEYADSYKIVNVTFSGSEKAAVLYLCGTPKPNITDIDLYVQIPVEKVAITSSTTIPYIEMLGERESIVAYTYLYSTVASACMRKLFDEGGTFEAYDEASFSVNNTLLERLGVDVTFADSADSYYNGFPFKSTSESTVIRAAEYVEFLSLFYNNEKKALGVFGGIEERYECTSDFAVVYESNPVPKVLWASWVNFTFAGTTTAGWDLGFCPNYYCGLIEDAAGDIILTDMVGNVSTSFGVSYYSDDQLAKLAADADVWIHLGDWDDAWRDNRQFLETLDVVEGGQVFDIQKKTISDWFEGRVAEPDLALQDIATAINGEIGGHTRIWLRNVFDEEKGEAEEISSCSSTAARLRPLASNCSDLTLIDFDVDAGVSWVSWRGYGFGHGPGLASVAVGVGLPLLVGLGLGLGLGSWPGV